MFLGRECVDLIRAEPAPVISSLRQNNRNLEVAEVFDRNESVPVLRNIDLAVLHPLIIKCSISGFALDAIGLSVHRNSQRNPFGDNS